VKGFLGPKYYDKRVNSRYFHPAGNLDFDLAYVQKFKCTSFDHAHKVLLYF
jgi:hypothetical protein